MHESSIILIHDMRGYGGGLTIWKRVTDQTDLEILMLIPQSLCPDNLQEDSTSVDAKIPAGPLRTFNPGNYGIMVH